MADPRHLQSVREYFHGHKEEIIRRYNAEGAGIGKQGSGDDRYAIVVYLKSQADRPKAPVEIEGIPLRFEVTGGFHLQRRT
jgi:hypothetical protein